MSIYEDVKAEFAADAPPMAIKSNFKTLYGYAKGVALGTFPDKAAATAAGATTTETVVDEDAYKAAKRKYDAFWSRVHDEWYSRVRAEHPEVNDEVFASVYSMAYDRGHSYGFNEVEMYISDYVDFAVKVIAASKATA